MKTQVSLDMDSKESHLQESDQAKDTKVNLNDLLIRKKFEDKKKKRKNLAIYTLSIFLGLILMYFFDFF